MGIEQLGTGTTERFHVQPAMRIRSFFLFAIRDRSTLVLLLLRKLENCRVSCQLSSSADLLSLLVASSLAIMDMLSFTSEKLITIQGYLNCFSLRLRVEEVLCEKRHLNPSSPTLSWSHPNYASLNKHASLTIECLQCSCFMTTCLEF